MSGDRGSMGPDTPQVNQCVRDNPSVQYAVSLLRLACQLERGKVRAGGEDCSHCGGTGIEPDERLARDPSRLYCVSCGSDLGPDDGIRDPDCMNCLRISEAEEHQVEPLEEWQVRQP